MPPRSNRPIELGETGDLRALLQRPAADPGFVVCAIAHHPFVDRIGEEHVLEASGSWSLRLSRLEPDFASESTEPAPLGVSQISREPLELRCTEDALVFSKRARGHVLIDGEPLDEPLSLPLERLRRGIVIELGQSVVLLLHLRHAESGPARSGHDMLGRSEAIQQVRDEVGRVADLAVPVLVRGETGTGKELVARALHALSGRRGNFVAVNMGAIPETTAAAELFGHVRGAFTDAKSDGKGYFQTAEHGTLFLDEIGEASSDIQVKLLRVLETQEVLRVGSAVPLRLDVRVVAATDADLELAIRERRFKAPLYHRLGQYLINLPPLRERPEDIPLLFTAFLREGLEKTQQGSRLKGPGPWYPAEVMARVLRHDWPGNVRQLRSFAHALAISNRGCVEFRLTAAVEQHLVSRDEPAAPVAHARPARELPSAGALTESEAFEALRRHDWEVRPAARALGIAANTLYQIIDRSPNLRRASDLSSEAIQDALEQAGGDQARAAGDLRLSLRGLRQRMRELGLLGDSR